MEGSLEWRIEQALESIRPFLNKDGGDISLEGIDGHRVYVRLVGNCTFCPMNFSTMKLGVENTIKEFAPEITEVINLST